MLHNEIPLLRIFVPFSAGIISGLCLSPAAFSFIVLALSSAIVFFIAAFYNKTIRNYWYGVAVSLALFACGMALYRLEERNISVLAQEEALFSGVLSDYPEEKENSWMLIVKLDKAVSGNESIKAGGSLVLYLTKDAAAGRLIPGDRIVFRCTPIPISNRGNPNEFDYKSYMERRHIRYYAFPGIQDIVSIQSPKRRNLMHTAIILRQQMIKRYMDMGISGNHLAIIAAVTLGEKDLLEPELRQQFAEAGVIHIMAVSGLHVGILSIFVYNILFFTGSRFAVARVLITIAFLWCFAFITGLAPPVLRATIMFSFLQAGKLMKRPVNNINIVLASALIILIIKPSAIFDTGFLLSYSAVLSIIGFYKDLYNKLIFSNWLADKIWQMVAVTLIAQAGTLPLTIMMFNRFPSYFILSNIIIVPLASLIVISGCLVWFTFPVPPVSGFFVAVADRLTGLTEVIAGKAASLPFSTIENIGMTPVECLALTPGIILALHYLLKNPRISIKYSLFFFIIFSSVLTARHISNGKTKELIVYNTQGLSTIGFRNGNVLRVYTTADTIPPEVTRHSATCGLVSEYNKLDEKPLTIRTGLARIIISDSLNSIKSRTGEAYYVILTGPYPYISKKIGVNDFNDLVLITTETSRSAFSRRYSSSGLGNLAWNVRESGAYRLRLGNK